MEYIQHQLSVKNVSDLTSKANKGKYDIKSLTKKQIRRYKRYGKEFIHCLNGL